MYQLYIYFKMYVGGQNILSFMAAIQNIENLILKLIITYVKILL